MISYFVAVVKCRRLYLLAAVFYFSSSVIFSQSETNLSFPYTENPLILDKILRNLSDDEKDELLKSVSEKKQYPPVQTEVSDEKAQTVTHNETQKSSKKEKEEKDRGLLKKQEQPLELSRIERLFMTPSPSIQYQVEAYERISPHFIGQPLQSPPWIESSEFEKQEDIVRQYGYDLFNKPFGKASQFTPVGDAYIVGPGDALTIRIWGKLEEKIDAIVDMSGVIYLPKIGTVSVVGETLGNVKKIIHKELTRLYVNFETSITLSQLRTIKVYILGDVAKPGAYDVSSLSTAFSALYTAGGPTKMGSLRKIVLRRNHRTVKLIDLYEYLLNGDRFQDPLIQANDTLFVPAIGDVVKIEGLIKRPGIFEVSSDTSIWEGITQLAGGFTPVAYGKRLLVERVSESDKKTILDYIVQNEKDLKALAQKTKLQNGDSVRVLPILDRTYNKVTIRGNVFRPGEYGFLPNLTLGDLIKNAEGLKEDSFLKRVDIYRYKSDKTKEILSLDLSSKEAYAFRLQQWDVVKIYSNEDIHNEQYIFIEGIVKKQGRFKLHDNLRISDAVLWAEPHYNADLSHVELIRKSMIETQEKRFTINIKALFENSESPDNLFLENGDRIFVREDPEINKLVFVTLKGEVRYPGRYVVQKDEPLSSIIERAGGFTERAFLDGAIFLRKTVKIQEEIGQKRILEEEKKRLLYSPQTIDEKQKFAYDETIRFLKEKSEENTGRMVINLKSLADFKQPKDDILPENGDFLYIPSMPVSVQVAGAVQNPISLLFVSGKTASFYIDKAGGYSEFADRGRVYIFKADGSVKEHSHEVLQFGDTIYIPFRQRMETDWLKILNQASQIVFNLATSIKFIRDLK